MRRIEAGWALMMMRMTKRGGEGKDMTPAVIWELVLICVDRGSSRPHYRSHQKAGCLGEARLHPDGVRATRGRVRSLAVTGSRRGATFSTGMDLATHGSQQGSRERNGVQERRGGRGGLEWREKTRRYLPRYLERAWTSSKGVEE